jgi:hypothetical protein
MMNCAIEKIVYARAGKRVSWPRNFTEELTPAKEHKPGTTRVKG